MKNISHFLLCAFCAISMSAAAQDNLEDVIFTKGGNIYRGLVIEQIPGESMKIRIEGGSVFTVPISDIQKLTKEEKWRDATVPYAKPSVAIISEKEKMPASWRAKYDSTYVPHFKRKNKYFFLAEIRAGISNGGVRIVNGFKTGRFGFFGAGIGIDGASFRGFGDYPYGSAYNYSGGAYLPIYFRYAGDILRTKITPFYYAELGYAANLSGSWRFTSGRSYGGPIAALGFGCKFNTMKRINFNINVNANWRTNFYNGMVETYSDNGTLYTEYVSGSDGRLFGNFCFGIGF